MRGIRLAGLLLAVVAAALVPAAAARPAGVLDQAMRDPFGLFWQTVPDELEPPVPEQVADNGVYRGGFCYFSSEFSFCTDFDDLGILPEGDDGVAETAGEEAAPAAAEATEEPGDEGLQEAPFEEPSQDPPFLVSDSAAPEPRAGAPEPPADAPSAPSEGASRVPAPASVPGLNWAVVTAAITLPWAIGLKVLATLFGLRRASRLAGGTAERPSLRAAVLEAVAGEPGIRHSDLVARIGRGNGTVEHHVRALLAEGRLARVRGLGSTLYFPAGALGEGEARMRLALQGRTSRRMAQALAARPGLRLGELARGVGVSDATAHYHAGKLVQAGVVREEAGVGRRLALTAEGEACLAALPAGPGAAPSSPQGRTWVPDASTA